MGQGYRPPPEMRERSFGQHRAGRAHGSPRPGFGGRKSGPQPARASRSTRPRPPTPAAPTPDAGFTSKAHADPARQSSLREAFFRPPAAPA